MNDVQARVFRMPQAFPQHGVSIHLFPLYFSRVYAHEKRIP
jgi:hypothetical protein